MNTKIKQARSLRVRQTSAERIMWRELRNRQLLGLKFRRQHNIGSYIADFYCEELGLVIEIDGDAHGYEKKYERDIIREEFLKNRNFEIIRYTNNDVYDNLEGVMEDLSKKCEKLWEKNT
ncbi:MAG: endonuclease domain-containing protein [Candidatus Pacebacteria bacterium]|nr:endonuclease domain-containing protein [Candidatus Paceibacterota bacterium]